LEKSEYFAFRKVQQIKRIIHFRNLNLDNYSFFYLPKQSIKLKEEEKWNLAVPSSGLPQIATSYLCNHS